MMCPKKVFFTLGAFAIAISGCGGGGGTSGSSSTPVIVDPAGDLEAKLITGTWLYSRHFLLQRTSSGEVLEDSITKERYLIQDKGLEVEYERCTSFGNDIRKAIKIGNTLSLEPGGEPIDYELLSSGELQREVVSRDVSDPDLQTIVTEKLQKLLDTPDRDAGSVVVNGQISKTEDVNVCVTQHFDAVSNSTEVVITVPYDDAALSFSILHDGKTVPIGPYTLESVLPDEEVDFIISSASTDFRERFQLDVLTPQTVYLDIMQYNSNTFEASFSFDSLAEDTLANTTGAIAVELHP